MSHIEQHCDKHESLELTVAEHGKILTNYGSRLGKLEVNDAVHGAKIDITNKILMSIAIMLGTSICGVLIGLLTHTIKL